MGDGSISIYEPPIQNSGFMGGKFLERQRIIRYKSKTVRFMPPSLARASSLYCSTEEKCG